MSPPGQQRGPESGESLQAPNALLGGAAGPAYDPDAANQRSDWSARWARVLARRRAQRELDQRLGQDPYPSVDEMYPHVRLGEVS
jgi:hypothetical protein